MPMVFVSGWGRVTLPSRLHGRCSICVTKKSGRNCHNGRVVDPVNPAILRESIVEPNIIPPVMNSLSLSFGRLSHPSSIKYSFLAGMLAFSICGIASATPPTAVDLSTYVRTARYNLPESSRTAAPADSLRCQEASNVTYNRDMDTLFVVGDCGAAVTQS
jgi:hypothetical protein